MPKSRNRKGHSSKVKNYRKKVEDRKKSYEKKLREQYEKMQQEALEQKISSSESQVQEAAVEGIESENFQIGNEFEIPTGEIGTVEGVIKPPM